MKLKLFYIVILTVLLTGCATYKATLINEKGETFTCEASGKNGILTGYILRKGFEDCVSSAKDRGFKETTIETQKKQEGDERNGRP